MTIPDDDNDLITRRLGQALEVEARRNPLPSGFSLTVADGLGDLPRRRRVSLFALPALAGTLVLAVAAAAVLLALSRSPISVPPGSSRSTSAVTPGLAHYFTDEFSFDYPADWRIIEQGIEARHYQWIPVVLGTGDWTLNCQLIPPSSGSGGGITCGADIFTVGAGQIVVEIYTWQGPPTIAQTPPPTAVRLPAGWSAIVVDTATTSMWKIYLPGSMQPLTVDARFADPGAEQMRAEVKSLVESLELTPAPVITLPASALPSP